MTEADKKLLRQDLVYLVLDAIEKSNHDRTESLIMNAIKQLKLSRYKAEKVSFISLAYLAKLKPEAFATDHIIEALTAFIRKDNVNIKLKNENLLPTILAANILLACSNTSQIRILVLQKIEQLHPSGKPSDLILTLLSTLCTKCEDDDESIIYLIRMKEHWIPYLADSTEPVGPISACLCRQIRISILNEEDPSSMLTSVKFLIKHDSDMKGVVHTLSEFIVHRPLTFKSVIEHKLGSELMSNILKLYINYLRNILPIKKENAGFEECLKINKIEIEAILICISCADSSLQEYKDLAELWFENAAFSSLCKNLELPLKLQLLHSKNNTLVDIIIEGSELEHLLIFVSQFGVPLETVSKILRLLDQVASESSPQTIPSIESLRANADCQYLEHLIKYFWSVGIKFGKKYFESLTQ